MEEWPGLGLTCSQWATKAWILGPKTKWARLWQALAQPTNNPSVSKFLNYAEQLKSEEKHDPDKGQIRLNPAELGLSPSL